MEKPPYIFQAITHFSVENVEKVDARIDYIKKLTLEIGSRIPAGRYSLVMIGPFRPLGRAGKRLNKLRSLSAKDIDVIYVFPARLDGRSAKEPRIEITTTNSDRAIIRCERIEGLPLLSESMR